MNSNGSADETASDEASATRLISIIVPCRNEAKYIAQFLNSILNQETGCLKVEVLVADGLSDDATRDILQNYAKRFKNIRVIDNEKQIVSAGLNAALRVANGATIIRMDVHTQYAPDYIAKCVEVLDASGADSVGGPWIADGNGWLSSAIAATFQSSICVGGARSHEADYEGPVDSVYLGCWNRQIFQRLGGFDERLIRNQDDEFSLRIVSSKGTIWQSPKIQSRYTPRNSLSALCRQYLQYGYWKVAVITKHGRAGSWRHLVPGAFVLAALSSMLAMACALLLIPEMVTVWMILVLGTPIILYAAFCAISAAIVARARGWHLAPILPVVIASYHVSYGLGFLLGLVPKMGMEFHSKYLEKMFTGLTR